MDGQTGEDAPTESRVEDKHEAQPGIESQVPEVTSDDTAPPEDSNPAQLRSTPWHSAPRRVAASLINSLRWVLSTLTAPGVYLIACLYDSTGYFSPFIQLKRLFGKPEAGQKLGVDGSKKMGAPAPHETSRYGPTHYKNLLVISCRLTFVTVYLPNPNQKGMAPPSADTPAQSRYTARTKSRLQGIPSESSCTAKAAHDQNTARPSLRAHEPKPMPTRPFPIYLRSSSPRPRLPGR